jgi:hypothetical protein
MGLGQLRSSFWETDEPRNCPNQISSFAGSESYVSDGGHRLMVMKKTKAADCGRNIGNLFLAGSWIGSSSSGSNPTVINPTNV